MTIDILYFDSCPNYEPTVRLVRNVADALGVEADIRHIRVDSQEKAERMEFIGSPTVRVNGVDVEPGAAEARTFGLTCRRYGSSGVPPREMVEAALGGGPRG